MKIIDTLGNEILAPVADQLSIVTAGQERLQIRRSGDTVVRNRLHLAALAEAVNGDVHDGDWSNSVVRLTAGGSLQADFSVTGIRYYGTSPNTDEYPLTVLRNGTQYNLILKHEDNSSSSDNRFSLPDAKDVVIGPDEACILLYAHDGATSRWKLISAPPTRLLTNIEPTGRVFLSRLPNVGTALLLELNKAYFVYLGRTAKAITVNHVEFYVNTAGSGTQAGEVGLFRTPSPPNTTNQGNNGISKLTAVALTGTEFTSTGVKRNASALNYTVGAGTHLWAGIRSQMGSTYPQLAGLCMDYSEGLVLYTASAGALTNAGPWTGQLTTQGTYLYTPVAPDLRITLD